ncbi:alpha/beta fold hydrolase [Pseudomonas sp. LF245]
MESRVFACKVATASYIPGKDRFAILGALPNPHRNGYNVIKQRLLAGCIGVIGLLAAGACATKQQPEPGIRWLASCAGIPTAALDPTVLARTQCGIVTVPLDHSNPSLGTISLDITRVAAEQPDKREGAVFTNPSGPGTNGSDVFTVYLAGLWKRYGERPEGEPYRHLTRTYDVIGLTPRGQGSASDSQLVCVSDEVIVAQNDITEDRSVANVKALQHNAQVVARGCAGQRLAPYINTEQTARDMEFVRVLLKEPNLNYFGNSYGTWLGAWYAGLFPSQVGRMVMDSSVDWTSTFQNASLNGAPEKERIFFRFVAEKAASNPSVYLMGDDPKAVHGVFLRLLPEVRAALRSDSLFYSSTEHLMAARILSDWLRDAPQLDDTVLAKKAQAHRFSPDAQVDGAARQAFTSLLDATRRPMPWNGFALGTLKLTPAESVRSTVLCNDSAASDEAFWTGKENFYATHYPIGGSFFAARHCAGWDGRQKTGVPLERMAQVDSIVMVQAEYDDQTPSTGALRAFDSLPNTHMVLLKGAHQHGVSFADRSACVNQYVGQYLAYGRKPERFSACDVSN